MWLRYFRLLLMKLLHSRVSHAVREFNEFVGSIMAYKARESCTNQDLVSEYLKQCDNKDNRLFNSEFDDVSK